MLNGGWNLEMTHAKLASIFPLLSFIFCSMEPRINLLISKVKKIIIIFFFLHLLVLQTLWCLSNGLPPFLLQHGHHQDKSFTSDTGKKSCAVYFLTTLCLDSLTRVKCQPGKVVDSSQLQFAVFQEERFVVILLRKKQGVHHRLFYSFLDEQKNRSAVYPF